MNNKNSIHFKNYRNFVTLYFTVDNDKADAARRYRQRVGRKPTVVKVVGKYLIVGDGDAKES